MIHFLYIFAQGKIGTPDELHLPVNDVNTQLRDGLKLVYAIAAVIAVVVIVIAGIQYSLSNGNAQTVAKAKNAIVYSVVGLIIIASAFMITSYVFGRMK